jgi:glutamine synthetase
MACMQEVQEQCFKMGIPLITRHREVAPNQYEFTPTYGPANIRIDNDLVVMQIIEEVSVKYGLTALFHEKPFAGVNGSGKHNNWSISTNDGTNLFNVARLAKKSRSREVFPIIMACLVQAVDQYGDLLLLACSTPGNELRLGGFEAPSKVVCMYLGDSLADFLAGYMNNAPDAYAPMSRFFDMGATALPPIEVPAEDRNRTSFFAYGGHRFEFRATGSSQNLSLVNTVLATICAKVFKEFADAISVGEAPRAVAMRSLQKHFRVLVLYYPSISSKLISCYLLSVYSMETTTAPRVARCYSLGGCGI